MAQISEIAQGAERGHHCRTCTCPSHDGALTTETDQSSEETIDGMDRELARMRAALDVLKRRRNARLAIARIPPELLSEIFLYLRDTSILPISEHWDTVPWMFITQISAHWRSVALSDPRLWNVVNLRFPDLVSRLSDYYSDMPLHVVLSRRVPSNFLDTDETLEYGFDYILDHPIVALEICAREEEATLVLQKLIPRAAHTLICLTIDMAEDCFWTSLEDTLIPTLRSFSISSLMVRPGCAFYASCAGSLRELKVGRNFAGSKWHAKDLEAFTRLERLRLLEDSVMFSVGETVSLPFLAELYIKENLDICLAGLLAFRLPAGCNVLLSSELPGGSTGGAPLQEIIALISSAHPAHARAYIGEEFIELRYVGAQDKHFALKLAYDSRMASGVETLAAILPHSTTELSVVCNVEPSHGTLEELAACKALQSLSVCGPFLVDSLLNSGRSETATSLPNLSLFRLCNCDVAMQRTLLLVWGFCEGLNVLAGRAELCRRSYKCVA